MRTVAAVDSMRLIVGEEISVLKGERKRRQRGLEEFAGDAL